MGNRAGSEPPLCGVILAGGEGRRMGHIDKAALPLAGTPLLAHVAGRLAPQVGRLAVSRAAGARVLPVPGLPCDLITDSLADRMGPLAGILAGLDWAHGLGAGHLLAVPVDGPFLPPDLALRLGRGAVPHLALAGGRQHPTFGVWPVALRGDLRAFLSSGAAPRLRDFAARAGAVWVDFSNPEAFENLNTPEDLRRAESRMGEGA